MDESEDIAAAARKLAKAIAEIAKGRDARWWFSFQWATEQAQLHDDVAQLAVAHAVEQGWVEESGDRLRLTGVGERLFPLPPPPLEEPETYREWTAEDMIACYVEELEHDDLNTKWLRHGITKLHLPEEAAWDVLRRCIVALLAAGACPVTAAGRPGWTRLDYGKTNEEIAKAIVDEERQDGPEQIVGKVWFVTPDRVSWDTMPPPSS